MMTDNGYSGSLGWAIADPILRAIVAMGAIYGSYPAMVQAHVLSISLGAAAFQAIGVAGGAGNPLDHMGHGAVGWSIFGTGMVGELLVDIIVWVMDLFILFLMLSSMVGYQICIVLAPLVIPIWVYSGNTGVFGWFFKTVVGALAVPVAVGIGWGVLLVLTHGLDPQRKHETWWMLLPGHFWQRGVQIAFLIAGIWFLWKLIQATTGELFRGQGLLATIFYAQGAMMTSARIARNVMPRGLNNWAYRRFAGANGNPVGRLIMPNATASFVEREHFARLSGIQQVKQLMEGNKSIREVVGGMLTREEYQTRFRSMHAQARSLLAYGNREIASELLSRITPARMEGLPPLVFETLTAGRQYQIAMKVLSYQGSYGANGRDLADHRRFDGQTRLTEAIKLPEAQAMRDLGRAHGVQVNTFDLVPSWDDTPIPPTGGLPRYDPLRDRMIGRRGRGGTLLRVLRVPGTR